MCLSSKKKLFVSSCATFGLVYICATNFEKNINIINGYKGSSLSEFTL